jgi:hypothetical protein
VIVGDTVTIARRLSDMRSNAHGDKSSKRSEPHPPKDRSKDQPKRQQLSDIRVKYEIERTTPGTAVDDQLRREQIKAVFDLLAADARRTDQADNPQNRKGR